jgi:hypothetical protein
VLFQGTFNDPHMEVDGVVKKVSNDFWAQKTLSPEEYQLFKAAAHRQQVMWSQMINSGLAEMTRDTNTASTTVTLHELVLHDPEYVKYMEQMLQDPAVTWPGPGIKPIY